MSSLTWKLYHIEAKKCLTVLVVSCATHIELPLHCILFTGQQGATLTIATINKRNNNLTSQMMNPLSFQLLKRQDIPSCFVCIHPKKETTQIVTKTFGIT